MKGKTVEQQVIDTLIKIGAVQSAGDNWYLSSPVRMLDIPPRPVVREKE